MSGHKALPVAQICERCGAVVNLHSAFVSRWTGHKNIFMHNSCFKKMVEAENQTDDLAPLIHPVSDDAE